MFNGKIPLSGKVPVLFLLIGPFRCTKEFTFPSPEGAMIFPKLRSKIAYTPKIGE